MADNISLQQGKACPICLETKRDARLLPCLHSLCRGCIDDLAISAGKEALCPVCRASFHISEVGGAAFPKDTEGSGKCDECGDEQVTMFCRSCQVFVCDADFVSHRVEKCGKKKKKRYMFEVMAQHFGKELSEATNDSSSVETVFAFPFCSDHGEEMTYHCLDCDTLICSDCVAFGDHCRHNATRAEQIVKERKTEIGKKVDKLRAEIEPRLVESIEGVDGVTVQLAARADQVRDEIRSATDKAIQMVKAVGEQLLQHVTDIEEERCKLLDEQRDALKRHLDSVRNAISFADCLLQQGQRVNRFTQLATLEKRVVSLNNETVTSKPVRDAELAFQCSKEHSLAEKAFQMTGQVLSCRGSARHSFIDGSSTVQIIRGSENIATFVLRVKDAQGIPVEKQADVITTKWLEVPEAETSQVPVTITCEDSSGQYRLSTRPTLPGTYKLEVAVNKEALSSCLLVNVVELMQFEDYDLHKDIRISHDRKTLTWSPGLAHNEGLRKVFWERDRFTWKINIGSTACRYCCLGIATKSLTAADLKSSSVFGSFHHRKGLFEKTSTDCLHFVIDCNRQVLCMANTRSNYSFEITGLPFDQYFLDVKTAFDTASF